MKQRFLKHLTEKATEVFTSNGCGSGGVAKIKKITKIILNAPIVFIVLIVLVVIPQKAQAQKYSPEDVAVINALIANNGLIATPNDPASWNFAKWNNENPKRIRHLKLNNRNMYGAASFAGLTRLESLECRNNNLSDLDVSQCEKLHWLKCKNNQLTELYVSRSMSMLKYDKNVKLKLITQSEIEEIERIEKEIQRIQREKESETLSYFAQNYVEQEITKWEQKGEFEKTADWQGRVNEESRQAKMNELRSIALRAFIADRSRTMPIGNITLGTYDADREVFLIKNDIYGDWLAPVPIDEAPSFRANWNNIAKTPQWVIHNDRLAFAGYKFGDKDSTAQPKQPEQPKETPQRPEQPTQPKEPPVKSEPAADVPSTKGTESTEVAEENDFIFRKGDMAISVLYSDGIGAKFSYNITAHNRLAGEFIYDAFVQYLIVNWDYLMSVGKRVSLYPSVGLGYRMDNSFVGNSFMIDIDGGIDISISPKVILNCKLGVKYIANDLIEGIMFNFAPALSYKF